MSADGSLSLVDTNVLIYAVSPDDRRHPIALALLADLLARKTFRTSTQVLQEFYAAASRKLHLSRAEAMRMMDSWAVLPIVLIDYPAICDAALLSETVQISFWDALIVIAAKRCGARRLYTEDLNHGQIIEGVEVVNPFR
jgi:predicted nucleic acid-binding protein